MKKTKIILLISVLLIVCIAAFAGCKPKDLKTNEILALASATGKLNTDTTIIVKSGETEVYSFKDGVNSDPFELGFDEMTFGNAGKGLPFSSANVKETGRVAKNELMVATFSVTNAEELLGEKDASNAEIKISYSVKNKSFGEMSIVYTTVRGETTFNVEILLKLKA